jgi:MFS family permease
MEEKVISRGKKLEPLPKIIQPYIKNEGVPYIEIFKNKFYLKRFAILLPVWFLAYTTVYSIASGLTSLLVSKGYSPPEAGMIAALGISGFIMAALIATFGGERLERKYWLGVASVITLIGGLIMVSTTNIIVSGLGAILLFIGFNTWVPIAYTWVTESFPTRARTSGFALTDGLGHLGGGIGVLGVTYLSTVLSVIPLFVVIASFLIIAALIAIPLGHLTAGKRLDEVSP